MPVHFSAPIGWLPAILAQAVPPVIVFGAPVQRGTLERESFWHVPIKIQPRLFGIGPATLYEAEVYLDEFSGDTVVNRIRLYWGDAKLEKPEPTALLRRNHPKLVPVAFRSEEDVSCAAFIADSRYFSRGESVVIVRADRQKHRYKLRVKSGSYEKYSPKFYVLRVPSTASNSHFTLEIEFEGGGSSPVYETLETDDDFLTLNEAAQQVYDQMRHGIIAGMARQDPRDNPLLAMANFIIHSPYASVKGSVRGSTILDEIPHEERRYLSVISLSGTIGVAGTGAENFSNVQVKRADLASVMSHITSLEGLI